MALPNSLSAILRSSKSTRWTLLVFTWFAFLLRVINLDTQSLWRDEVDAIRFSSESIHHLIVRLFGIGHNGPLFFLLLRPWRALTGDSEFALRYPSALLGTLAAVPLGYVLARQLSFGRRAGLLLAVLLTTSSYLVWYGQEAKMYAWLLPVVMLAFIAYLRALTGSGARWWTAFVVSASISFYLHILAPLMLVVYVIAALLYYADWRRRWRAWLISMACLTVPYMPLVVWQFNVLVDGANVTGKSFSPLHAQYHILLQLYTSGFLGVMGLVAVAPFAFLIYCGLFLPNRRDRVETLTPTKRLLLAVWVLVPPLLVFIVSLRVPVFEHRYLIYITPAFYLIAVLGLMLVRQHSRLIATLLLGLILSINLVNIWQQQRLPVKADFRAAAEYLSSHPGPPETIMIHAPYLHYTLNYYYPQNYNRLDGIWTNADLSQAALDAEMTSLTSGLGDLWLVASEEDLWDERRLVRAWLDENADLVTEASFEGVEVYHYQLRTNASEE
jgi:uncharacterized membrane protein